MWGARAEVDATAWPRTAVATLLIVVLSSLSYASVRIIAAFARRLATCASQLLALVRSVSRVPRRDEDAERGVVERAVRLRLAPPREAAPRHDKFVERRSVGVRRRRVVRDGDVGLDGGARCKACGILVASASAGTRTICDSASSRGRRARAAPNHCHGNEKASSCLLSCCVSDNGSLLAPAYLGL